MWKEGADEERWGEQERMKKNREKLVEVVERNGIGEIDEDLPIFRFYRDKKLFNLIGTLFDNNLKYHCITVTEL